MSLNETVSGERLHIGFFGMRNAGKSSLMNAVTGQQVSLVSDIRGTTTDPVKKAMELAPLGPVLMIDTPGIDDEGELGRLRAGNAGKVLASCDIAVLVADARQGMSPEDEKLIERFRRRDIPFLKVYSKSDLLPSGYEAEEGWIYASARTGENIDRLKDMIAAAGMSGKKERYLTEGIISEGGTAGLIIPVDSSAPRGRLILPQQQTLRELLDRGCITAVIPADRITETLGKLKEPPDVMITDSQIFSKADSLVPEEIPLTSFSILFARYKGELEQLAEGAALLPQLVSADRVLICEGCTHHRQCGDIGSEKIPGWVRGFCHDDPKFEFTSGGDFPDDLSEYRLIIHCGGCMLTEREMKRRMKKASDAGVPMVNYGIAIAHMHGVLERSIKLFPEIDGLQNRMI